MRSPNRTLSKIANLLGVSNQARYLRAINTDRRTNPADYQLADDVIEAFHSQGGLKQYTQPYKLVSLMRMLRTYKPARILELGTGSSSVVMAKYAQDTGAVVTHVDEHKKWLDNTQRNISKFVGLVNAQFVHAEASLDDRRSPPHFWYSCDIDNYYDMIFVDGPALYIGEESRPDGVSSDILRMAPELLPRFVVVDMRAPTVNALSNGLSATHKCCISDVLARKPRKSFRYFTVFQRKDVTA